MATAGVFLSAEWRYLVMLNYPIDPGVLESRVPRGTEIDTWNGQTFVSVVGFLFLNTRVLGLPVPFHQNFEEVNLRFYIRRRHPDGNRRAVGFVKEIVPRPAVATVAQIAYNENYVALPMRHRLETVGDSLRPESALGYYWKHGGRWNAVRARITGEPKVPEPGSEPEFIAEHYWGYAKQRDGGTVEYQVEHIPWRVWNVSAARLDCNVRSLYGAEFVQALSGPPSSAFVAEGSPIIVRKGTRIA